MRHLRMVPKSRKAGLPPGSVEYVGERKVERAEITIFDYDADTYREKRGATVDECAPFKDSPSVTWINVDGVADTETIKALGERYDLHPLVLEDIVTPDQRPKMEDYGSYIYIVLNMLSRDPSTRAVQSEQISIVLGANYVLSFQEKPGDVFDPIRERIRNNKGRIRRMKADYLAYALIDTVVDHYFIIMETMEEWIEEIEEKLIDQPSKDIPAQINAVKRDLVYMRRSLWPLRELVSGLQRSESPLLDASLDVFLRDVYDHTIQVIETLETFRDILSGLIDIYMTSVSNRMNEIMKTLTIIATIFIPLTFIAGVYGMNFHYMPALDWRWGYYAVWGVMIALMVSLILYFRKRDWL